MQTSMEYIIESGDGECYGNQNKFVTDVAQLAIFSNKKLAERYINDYLFSLKNMLTVVSLKDSHVYALSKQNNSRFAKTRE